MILILEKTTTKVVNSGEQISELEVVKKFNLGWETSNNNSSKKENNSNVVF